MSNGSWVVRCDLQALRQTIFVWFQRTSPEKSRGMVVFLDHEKLGASGLGEIVENLGADGCRHDGGVGGAGGRGS